MQAKQEMEAIKNLSERATKCVRKIKHDICSEDEEWKSR